MPGIARRRALWDRSAQPPTVPLGGEAADDRVPCADNSSFPIAQLRLIGLLERTRLSDQQARELEAKVLSWQRRDDMAVAYRDSEESIEQ